MRLVNHSYTRSEVEISEGLGRGSRQDDLRGTWGIGDACYGLLGGSGCFPSRPRL